MEVGPMWIEVSERAAALLMSLGRVLLKGRTHKYIRRVPKPGGGYRYYYKTSGVTRSVKDDLVTGAKFRLTHEGKEGHFEVVGRSGDTVTLRHDESGGTMQVSAADLSELLKREHASVVQAQRERTAKRLAAARKHGTAKQVARLEAEAKRFGVNETGSPAEKVISAINSKSPSKIEEALKAWADASGGDWMVGTVKASGRTSISLESDALRGGFMVRVDEAYANPRVGVSSYGRGLEPVHSPEAMMQAAASLNGNSKRAHDREKARMELAIFGSEDEQKIGAESSRVSPYGITATGVQALAGVASGEDQTRATLEVLESAGLVKNGELTSFGRMTLNDSRRYFGEQAVKNAQTPEGLSAAAAKHAGVEGLTAAADREPPTPKQLRANERIRKFGDAPQAAFRPSRAPKTKAAAQERAKAFVSKDASRPNLAGAFYTQDKLTGGAAAIAVDGHRLAAIPTTGADDWHGTTRDASGAAIDTVFPDYQGVTGNQPKMEAVDAQHLQRALNAALAFSNATKDKGAPPVVKFEADGGKLYMAVEPSDPRFERARVHIGSTSKKDGPLFKANAKFLKDAMSGATGAVNIGNGGRLKPIHIQREDGEYHVIMPVGG